MHEKTLRNTSLLHHYAFCFYAYFHVSTPMGVHAYYRNCFILWFVWLKLTRLYSIFSVHLQPTTTITGHHRHNLTRHLMGILLSYVLFDAQQCYLYDIISRLSILYAKLRHDTRIEHLEKGDFVNYSFSRSELSRVSLAFFEKLPAVVAWVILKIVDFR